MTNFTLQFLGQFHVRVDERPIHDFHSEKARALLAYLALEPQEHARSQLATLFWPEIGDQYARTNLRNTLYRLRQTLDGALPGAADQLIAVTRQAVRFNADSATVDALRFQASLAEAQQAPTPDPDRLAEALELYHGELLPGFGVDDAPTFEEWLLLRRELLHQQAILAFHMVTTAYETTGQYAQALRMVGRQLTLDPYREESHRQSMRLLAYMGHPAQALQQLERMRHLLREELGVDPSAETVALGQAIASGEIAERDRSSTPLVNRSSPPSPGSSSLGSSSPGSSSLVSSSSGSPPPLDLSDVPEPGLFLGRAQERARLVQWLGAEQCRVVAILGLGGMGKTTLAAQSVREIATGEERRHFDAIYWRSLLNAPSLTDLLSPLLQHLSEQQLTKLPTSVDDQLRLLLEQLSRQRVLLVLDNFESILLPEEAGTYRPGYEGYGQLIHQLATLTHQSRLLLTSRERPRGYARLERDGYPIRSLPLSGLDNVAGRQLLIQRGLSGAGGEETILLERYSGNPLALKLVADTVDEIFGGDVMEFLHEEVLLFDDIRTVLDQQFARLTDGEQQILFWLAIEREATPLPVLRNNLLHVPPQGFLVETMRNLQRRSLIERQADGFALQNVVTEYLTDRLIDSVCTELETGELKHLHEHALLKAQAKEYVRATQARLILKPIGEQLIERLGRSGAQLAMQRTLTVLRTHELRTGDYAAGNLLNLLLCHNFDPAQMDFSHLAIRQAYLQGASLAHVNFAHATFFESLFTNHFGRVAALAISPDSQLLAVGANDGNIRLWQLRDGQLLCILGGHQSTVVSVAFRPDGRQLVSSSGSHGTLYLWDVASGARLFSLSGHQGGVGVVTFSPDGTLIASGGHDGTIRLWDAQSGKPLAILEKHTDWVRALAFDPSGALLISSGLDQSCCYVWQRQVSQAGEKPADAAHYRCVGTLDGHTMPVLSAAFSPNGALLATGSTDATVILWDVLQRTAIATLPDQGGEVHFVAFSPDGAVLAVNNRLTNINLWDVANRRLINVLHRHERQVWDIAISNDGKTLASGGSDGLVHLWDIRNPQRAQLIRTLHGSVQPIYALRINPQGDLFATGEEEGRVRLWQLEEDRGEEDRGEEDRGKRDVMQPLRLLTGHTALVDDLAFSPAGHQLASGAHDGTVRLWDLTSGECIGVLPTAPNYGSHSTFSPDGTTFAYVSFDTVHLMRIEANGEFHPLQTLQGHSRSIRAICFSPDGKYLASCSTDNSARLWEVATGVCLHLFDDEVINFWSLTFSPDGNLLAGGGRTGIHIWDLHSAGRARNTYASMTTATNIRPVAFSESGAYLASGGIDRVVRIWDLANDVQLHSLVGHTADVTSVVFLPGDELLISGSYDGTARLWDWQTGECRQTVRVPGPYAGMNISGVAGISEAQRTALKALGAIEE